MGLILNEYLFSIIGLLVILITYIGFRKLSKTNKMIRMKKTIKNKYLL